MLAIEDHGVLNPLGRPSLGDAEHFYTGLCESAGRDEPEWLGMTAAEWQAANNPQKPIKLLKQASAAGVTVKFREPRSDWYAAHVRAHLSALARPFRHTDFKLTK